MHQPPRYCSVKNGRLRFDVTGWGSQFCSGAFFFALATPIFFGVTDPVVEVGGPDLLDLLCAWDLKGFKGI